MSMAAESDIVRGIYTGEEEPEDEVVDEDGEVWPIILRNVTHLTVHDSVTVIPEGAFKWHPNIVELICQDGVIKIEEEAFENCPRLKHVIMNGVEEVEMDAFCGCPALEYVECKKLEIIGSYAFGACESLKGIDLTSAKIVEVIAFEDCFSLVDVKFGKMLESIREKAFNTNPALKRITIPLKSSLFTNDDVFVGCENLDELCLIEDAIIHETVDALLLDEWKNDISKEMDSINQTLPNADSGEYYGEDEGGIDVGHEGEKTRVIRDWIECVLRKIIHYKVEHYRLLSLAAAALAHASPYEIVISNVLSFLELPDHAFEGEGDSGATTLALIRQMWENVVQMEQRLLEKDTEIASLRSQSLLEKDMEIASLNALNDEKEDEINQLKLRVAQLELQVAESESKIMTLMSCLNGGHDAVSS